MNFEENLDKLSDIIKKSRSKKLRVAFLNYLISFNSSMQMYINFMRIIQSLGIYKAEYKAPSEWDVEFVQA